MLTHVATYELVATEVEQQVVLGDGATWIKNQATDLRYHILNLI
ncbi:MAG: hypothetical protein ACXWPS_08785 [Ktedonobacteraceae bacterium]